MSIADDLKTISEQEQNLRFVSFNEDDAWTLGAAMHRAALAKAMPVVIDLRIGQRQLFFCALPGTSADNSNWVRRKANSVQHFSKSTYRLNREALLSGKSFGETYGLDPQTHVSDGGGFPLHIIGTGVVGAITVSGVPMRDDHGFVVEQLCLYLNIEPARLALGPETS